MEKQQHFALLDGCRGVAAICVLLHHASMTTHDQMMVHGYLAVDLFFCLSGFVIAHAYEDRIRNGLSPLAFMGIRIRRLYPMIILGAMLCAVMLDTPDGPGQFAAAILAIPYYLPGRAGDTQLFPLNLPSWSIFWELVVNLLYASLLVRMNTRQLGALIAMLVVALTIIVLLFGNIEVGMQQRSLWAGIFRAALPFLVGVVIFRLRAQGRLQRLSAPIWLILGVMLAVLWKGTPAAMTPYYDLAVACVVMPWVVAAASNAQVPVRFGQWCVVAGAASYPIYILQGAFTPAFGRAPAAFGLAGHAAQALIIAMCIIYVLLAHVVLKRIDEPLQRWLRARITTLMPRHPQQI